jgi:Mg2+ and Co2+ transporter CorA
MIVRCAVCDETRSSYDEIEKHLEADHNAQPEIANLIIKMLQELQKMITTNNELKRELNNLKQMLKGKSKVAT